jgi:cell division protein ZapA (FtsZ GTPase activity inhibitor)
MSELSIKVAIANRVYPLSVLIEEEEEVRKAAAYINERIKVLESSFAVKDKIDLFAMLVLELTIEKGHGKEELVNQQVSDKLSHLIDRIDSELAAK